MKANSVVTGRGAILAAVALAILVVAGSFIFSKIGQADSRTKPDRPPAPSDPITALKPVTERQSDRRLPDIAAEGRFPDNPAVAIDVLSENLSGKELRQELNEAGLHYAKLGIDEAKVFLQNLPPGKIGELALRTTVSALDTDEEVIEMIGFLKDGAGVPSEWVDGGISSIRTAWCQRDPAGALAYFSSADVLSEDDQFRFASQVMYVARPAVLGELVAMVDGIGGEVGSRLRTTEPYILGKLRDDPQSAISGLADLPEPRRGESFANLSVAIQRLSDPTSSLDALANSDIPERGQVLQQVAGEWIRTDTNAALDWLGKLDDQPTVDRIISDSWKTIAKFDVEAASQWISSIENRELREKAEKWLRSFSEEP